VRVVVTGAAGFVGSHVAEAMARAGHEVLAVDALDRSASPDAARANWATLAECAGIVRIEADLARADLAGLTGADVVVHLAGRPGVRSSWGAGRADAERDNVTATRRLLAACAARKPRVIVASSSSVYGSAGARPHAERDPLRPASPYAASKAEMERLTAEAVRRGLPAVVLRLFSVYGPRQRPDMGIRRFLDAALEGRPVQLYGDGEQTRDLTYVADAVRANLLAMTAPIRCDTVNVGGGRRVSVNQLIHLVEQVTGCRLRVEHHPAQPGDVRHTGADGTRAEVLLGYRPQTGVLDGLTAEAAWLADRRRASSRKVVR
jgi:nucleoside-diphosphate-sugar epimerase